MVGKLVEDLSVGRWLVVLKHALQDSYRLVAVLKDSKLQYYKIAR